MFDILRISIKLVNDLFVNNFYFCNICGYFVKFWTLPMINKIKSLGKVKVGLSGFYLSESREMTVLNETTRLHKRPFVGLLLDYKSKGRVGEHIAISIWLKIFNYYNQCFKINLIVD